MATRDINPLMLGGATINRNSPQAAGLVSVWNPNVFPAGNVLYDRAEGRNGTIATATWTADAELGHTLLFNGASGHINCGRPAALNNLSQRTVTAWIRPESKGDSGDGRIVDKSVNGGMFFFRNAPAELSYYQDHVTNAGGWDTTNSPIVFGTVHHVVLSYDSSSVDNDPVFYVDGIALALYEGNAPEGALIDDSGNNFNIGNRADNARTFDGSIGEVRVYDRILSAAEIKAIYQNPYDLWQPTMTMEEGYVAAAGGHPALRRFGAVPGSMIYHRNAYTRWG